MASFKEDLSFALDVLRIRNAILDGSIYDALPIGWVYGGDTATRIYYIKFPSNKGNTTFGSVKAYETDDSEKSFITHAFVSLISNHKNLCTEIMLGEHGLVPLIEYDEATYFQHSLLYSDYQLRGLVVASFLNEHPSSLCVSFKIAFHYVPIITKLLRYRSYGIIRRRPRIREQDTSHSQCNN